MSVAVGSEAEHHVAGLYTQMLLKPLVDELSAGVVEDILRRAGETRSLEELCDAASWSSFEQFKSLLQESKRSLNSFSTTGATGLRSVLIGTTELLETAQALGSPASLFTEGSTENPLLPVRRYETTEIGPNEWTIRERFVDGFEPYAEFCEFSTGLLAVIPMIFGLPAGEVVEEECQCRGDATCLFRLSWQSDDEASRIEFLEVRTQLLETRLSQVHEMIEDLATNERYEDVLRGIVGSSLRAVGAGGAVLALEPRTGAARKVYSQGLTEAEASSLAEDVLGDRTARPEVFAVEVASARHRYGVLAVNGQGGVFASHSRGALRTYARLAAAALDSADALETARLEANTARVLLALSSSLAQIENTDEMVSRVVQAVPALVDCDRVALFMHDVSTRASNEAELRLIASSGYPDEAIASLRSVPLNSSTYAGAVVEDGITTNLPSSFGTVAALMAPIHSADRIIGYIVVGVTSDPERLAITPQLAERLKGLAAQASIAISNAILVDQIRFQAVHDGLTGLPNRSLILDRTEQMLARAHRNFAPVAALFIDLDGFKDINDTLGHGVGDQLLKAVTKRLAAAMRASDSVGRLGGDEFVVLVDGSTMDAGPELVADRLLSILRRPFEVDGVGSPLKVTASIGIAEGLRPSANELLRDADIALYQAKAAGKDCYAVFHPQMHEAVQDHHQLEVDLLAALSHRQFFLVYQPIFNLRSRETTGVEALLRWRHPQRGVVQPDTFVPALETSGMITDVGRWVLEEACRQGARWHSHGHQMDIAVNVSTRQLESDRFLADVEHALVASGFAARSLILEITETGIMRNIAAVIPRLSRLKELGVRIAIDDFGTGYSSLAYLQQFPVDTLKIDRSFIASMADSPEAGALVSTLIQLGKTLGLETLAEGIEESDQYTQLQRECCDSGQGYLYARPLELDAVEAFLSDRSASHGAEAILPSARRPL